MNSINEIAGRLWVWETSLLKTKDLLNLAFRANLNKPQGDQKNNFPTYLDCCSIYETCIELAIIYFCQIFNRGDGQNETIAANEKSFRDAHLEKIINIVFSAEDQKKRFNVLKNNILVKRNEMVAHADGSSFNISYGTNISVMKGRSPISQDIDIEFWESILEPLKTGIVNYTNTLKIKQII